MVGICSTSIANQMNQKANHPNSSMHCFYCYLDLETGDKLLLLWQHHMEAETPKISQNHRIEPSW